MILFAAAAASTWCAPALTRISPAACKLLGVVRCGCPDGIALTFDDGPHPEGTPMILDALCGARRRATFFLVGEQAERWPELVREIVRSGHEIGLHGYRHRNPLQLGPKSFARDLARATRVLTGLSGTQPTLYRPPYGILSPPALVAAHAQGFMPVLWSRWGRDTRPGATSGSILRNLGDGLRVGEILLLHDSDHYGAAGCHRRTAEALPTLLDELTARGFRTVALRPRATVGNRERNGNARASGAHAAIEHGPAQAV